MTIDAPDDFEVPATGGGDCLRHPWSLISSVSKYRLDERKPPSHPPQQITGAIAILNVCGKHAHT